MSTIYLIPARGGSKGIKNKNTIEIGKLPLFVWSVIHANFLSKKDDLIVLDFPIDMPSAIEIDNLIEEGVGTRPIELYKGRDDYLAIFEDIACIQNPALDFIKIAELNARGLIISAKGKDVDFVSRCFYPQTGVNEDPVTGSAHTLPAPYWASQLKKSELSAAQLSFRGGSLSCRVTEDRVLIGGHAVIYSKGNIFI